MGEDLVKFGLGTADPAKQGGAELLDRAGRRPDQKGDKDRHGRSWTIHLTVGVNGVRVRRIFWAVHSVV